MLTAGIEMIGRSGADEFQIRYHDDEEPTLWMAAASWKRPGGTYWDSAGGMTPRSAVLRLVGIVFENALCIRCQRKMTFSPQKREDILPKDLETRVKSDTCYTGWDPETKKFLRDCEVTDVR